MEASRKQNLNRKSIRIAQLNAQNSKVAKGELRRVKAEKKIDAVAIQEPYNRNGIITGLGFTTKINKYRIQKTSQMFPMIKMSKQQ